MRGTRRAGPLLLAATLALATLGLGGTTGAGGTGPGVARASNLGTVVAGRVYRSRAPSRPLLIQMRDRYGVGMVLDLRSPAHRREGPRIERERAWASELGLAHVQRPFPLFHEDLDPLVDELDALVATATEPILIHCQDGKDRTGTLVALLRLRQGWSYEQALDEMVRHGHQPHADPELHQFLRSRFARAGVGPAGAETTRGRP